MKANIVNKLTIQFNNKIYKENDIYLTIGIKYGFSINKVIILPQDQIEEINQGSGDVFVNYIKLMMKEKYNMNVIGNVKSTTIYLSMMVEKSKMDESVENIIRVSYEEELDEKLFDKAKEMSKKNLLSNYIDTKFRAYYKMMEFVNINKGFNLRKLTKDYVDITFEDFKKFRENVVLFQNSIFFINGDLSELSKSEIFDYISKVRTKEISVMLATETVNKYLQSDVHLIKNSKENVTIGGINFNFFNEDTKMIEKELLLNMLSEIMFGNKGKVILDEFDCSLLYFDLKFNEYRRDIYSYIDEKKVLEGKSRLLHKISYMFQDKIYIFNKYYIDLYLKGIDFADYYEVLKGCDCKLLQDIYRKGNLKITEGNLLYIKE